jgi:DNA polymerase-3 subunit delta'
LLIRIGCDDAVTNADMLAALEKRARGYSLAQIRSFVDSIQAAEEQLKQNANPRLVLEVLMLSIPEGGR